VSLAVAVAHPNVALSKYWGKREGEGNFPAVPSVSVTLSGLQTRTSVRFDEELAEDDVVLDGAAAAPGPRARVVQLLDRVRAASHERRRARVRSRNDFPTASGLASSASGFAALALASVRAAGLDWSVERVSDLARRSSASAGRSLFGGFVELEAGRPGASPDTLLPARALAPADHLPLVVLVCVATEAAKDVGSTDGMRATMARSPYAQAWLDHAPRLHARLRDALMARDLATVGELAEASCLAMHASAIAAGVVYWSGATLAAMASIRALRAAGVAVFASIDAGPHVKALTLSADVARARAALGQLPGITRIIEARPGEGASLVAHDRAEDGP
jgi:diphosphomevalonate decarboxylase